jgi:RES domain-containing protein
LTIFPPQLATPLHAWRIDAMAYAASWDSGLGAQAFGGRWNPPGTKAVYCALDPSTAILEVAVHKGFPALDRVGHVSTVLEIADPADVHVVQPKAVPEPGWLLPGVPGPRQQAWGAGLLAQHLFVAIPSSVSRQAWNLVFDPDRAARRYRQRAQEPLSIDPRLDRREVHPPTRRRPA